jgi:asparagine synthase (glutamine-hydrolysing)
LPSPRSYWDLSFETREGLTEEQACGELVELLSEAVDIRMIADVPLGAFLSGGVDSSSVVAMMAGLSEKPVESFSIGFDQASFDETRYAAEVAKAHNTRHHLRKVDANEFDLVDSLAGIYDEPFADSSAIPTYRLSAMTREQVTVALSGDGGDEVLAGYRRHRWHHYEEQIRDRVPQGIRAPIFGLLGSIYPKMDWAPQALRAKSTFQALARDSVGGYFDSVSITADNLRRKLYSAEMCRDLQGYHAREVLADHMEGAPTDDHLGRVQYADIKTYLPGDILTKVDRASMANSLEVRVPILDHHFVEWAARLPMKLRLNGREGKYVLKKAMEDRLSHNVLYRKKMGFAVPLRSWFRGPLRERVRASLTAGCLAETGYFDMAFIAQRLDQHQAGIRDHSAMIWALVMFESFLRKIHLGNP